VVKNLQALTLRFSLLGPHSGIFQTVPTLSQCTASATYGRSRTAAVFGGFFARGGNNGDVCTRNLLSRPFHACAVYPPHPSAIWTSVTRSSAIAERPARRSRYVSVEMLAHCCTNNANRSRVNLRSTFSNCHVLFR